MVLKFTLVPIPSFKPLKRQNTPILATFFKGKKLFFGPRSHISSNFKTHLKYHKLVLMCSIKAQLDLGL